VSDRPAKAPRTRAEVDSEQAQQALQRGRNLLDAGRAAEARPWLERACRIAPDNATALLPLAVTLLTLGDPAAEDAFSRLAARHDVREVWIGLAAARQRLGDEAGAAAALAASLIGHALEGDDDWFGFADGIAARAGAPGWCGMRGDGAVVVRPAAAGAKPTIWADGVPLRARRVPPGVRRVRVAVDGADLLGSPLDAATIRRVEGFVACRHGALEGWAWHPGDATRDPVLWLDPVGGGPSLHLLADDIGMTTPRPLARPRGFAVPASRLAGIAGPIRVRGADGRELMGSPLDPGQEARAAAAAAAAIARALPVAGRMARTVPWLPMPADIAAAPARAPKRPRRSVAVVVPVYRDLELTLACLDAVAATALAGIRIVVVDDASPEPALSAALDELARRRRIVLHRHARNRGFPAAANAGLRLAAALPGGPDVVLVNSDTLPAPGWLATLRAAVHASADIGTAAPLSNDASILSYPTPADPAPVPSPADLVTLAALAGQVLGAATVDIPTSVGFCMYIRRECLAATGLLRTDVFGQGYGEENDFCQRAKTLGWRHVAAPGAYVAHLGGRSFGDARTGLLARNLDVMERLHPGYDAMIRAWQAADPLAPARRALDAARWAAKPRARASARPVVLITHDSGGGVERAVRARCAALAAEGRSAIVLRPVVDLSGDAETAERRYLPGLCVVGDGPTADFPNLRFRMPDDLSALAALLRADRPAWVEVHHLLGHHHSVVELAAALRIPYDMRVHDYASICARINLVGPERRYCGEPDVSACVPCIADAGRNLEEPIEPAALRARSATDFSAARAVIAPSADTAGRLQRYFPRAAFAVRPHEDDTDLPPLNAVPPGPRRVAVIGAIGIAKGYEALLACARDAQARDLALSFTVVGHTEDDARLLDTGRVFVAGPFKPGEAAAAIRAQSVHLAWLPSVWPETWCYALGDALRAGLPAVAFDLGAQAERLRATGRGLLLPLGLPPPAINNALLALHTNAGDDYKPRVETSHASQHPPTPRPVTARS
jgi:GT2 family glycosyltransferase/glycosyltransferase involved in cell wall biosynthesis